MNFLSNGKKFIMKSMEAERAGLITYIDLVRENPDN